MREKSQLHETSPRLVWWALGATAVIFAGAILLIFMCADLADWLSHHSPMGWTALGLVASYLLARAYLRHKGSRERRRTIEAMVLFWSWQDRPEGVPDPMEGAWFREKVEAVLNEWAWGVLKVKPGSEYPKTPFELVERVAANEDRQYEKLRAMRSAGTRITLRDHADEGV